MTRQQQFSLFLLPVFSAGLMMMSGCNFFLFDRYQFEPLETSSPEDKPAIVYEAAPQETVTKGYRSIAKTANGFVAVGTEGRIDKISPDGTIVAMDCGINTTFNHVLSIGNRMIIVGDDGLVMPFDNTGQLSLLTIAEDVSIRSITDFKGSYIVGGTDGLVGQSFQGQGWTTHELELEGTIVGMGSNGEICIGITDAGEIISSNDGQNWNVKDYNEIYDRSVTFRDIKYYNGVFYVIGCSEDNTPLLISSEGGIGWIDMRLDFSQNDHLNSLVFQPNALIAQQDRLIAACDDGWLLFIDLETALTTAKWISGTNYTDVVIADSELVMVGDEYTIKSMPLPLLNADQ